MVVAALTSTSRVSGVVRILAVGAVLGPTHLGDAYQVTNTLPNLVWYGFLAGSLVPALLVPVLMRQLELRRPDRVEAVSRGFLGIAALAAAVIAPLAMLGLPLVMRVATLGISAQMSDEQVRLARLLVLLTVPQTFLYAVIGTARRRDVLAGADSHCRRWARPWRTSASSWSSASVALTYGRSSAGSRGAPGGELVLLGAGSTAAVALNAGLQWWGARRCGVSLFPTWGWRDETLRVVLRRTRHSVISAALLAAQTLLILLLASRVVGGAVALQVAFNFYVLPVAIIATPIGLALLPELSALVHAGEAATVQRDPGARAGLGAVPGGAGGRGLRAARASDRRRGGRRADGHGGRPRHDLRVVGRPGPRAGGADRVLRQHAGLLRPWGHGHAAWCMVAQALGCLVLCGGAVVLWDATALVNAVAAAYAVATLAGGLLLLGGVARRSPDLLGRLGAATVRIAAGVAVMALPVHFVSIALQDAWPGRSGAAAALVVCGLTRLGAVPRNRAPASLPRARLVAGGALTGTVRAGAR